MNLRATPTTKGPEYVIWPSIFAHLGKEGYAHKTINAMDGTIGGFFTANLGKVAMVNVKN